MTNPQTSSSPPSSAQGEDGVIRSKNGRYHHTHRKLRVLSRDNLDRRTSAFRDFIAIVDGISADLGGAEALSTTQRNLIDTFAGQILYINDLNTRRMLGQKVDGAEYSLAASTALRLAQRLGIDPERQSNKEGGNLMSLIHQEREQREKVTP